MKKLIMAVIALCLMVCLVGCKESNETKTELEQEPKESVHIWIDEKTGVQYLIYCESWGYGGMGGITPRLNADGTLYTEEGK